MGRRPELIAHARSIVNVNALVVGALALGLVSNVLIAALFGLSGHVDAFFAAAVVPSLVMALCIDYLGKNFLPVLASARQVGDACASSVTSSIVTWVALIAAIATGALVLLSRPLFGALLPGFDAAGLDLVTRYFAIMAPSIVLMAVNTFHEYVWQFEERFTYISMSRAALPAANLLALLLLAPWLHEYCLPVGYLIGHVTVFLLLLRGLPYRYRPHLALRPGFERRVFGNSAIVMSTGFVARSKSIVLNYLASQLGSGAIAALALASKLTEPLERSAFTGIRMLLFSKTVRCVVDDDRRRLGALYSTGVRAAFFVLAPLLWWIALNSEALVRLLFLRGEFTPEMAHVVAGVLCALIPSVLFLGVNQLLSNAFYAMNRVTVPAVVMPLGTLLYVAAAVPLSSLLGTQGLAIATTLSAFAVLATLLAVIGRQVPEIGLARTTSEIAFYAVLAGIAMLGTTGVFERLDVPPLATALCTLPIGVLAYGATLYLAADRTAVALFDIVRGYWESLFRLSADRSSKAPPARKTD
jgi:putative peptidoglycan lipid II flippase